MDIVYLKTTDLESNTGQVPGLPSNPRQWTQTDIDKIAKSLTETPELFEARPILVYPQDGKYIIMGGNLRFEGARHNKMKKVPAIVLPADTPVEKLKEIVIKDNGSFGEWDFDALANEWDVPLADWGVPAWNPEFGELPEVEGDPEPPDLSRPFTIVVEVDKEEKENLETITALIEQAIAEYNAKIK